MYHSHIKYVDTLVSLVTDVNNLRQKTSQVFDVYPI